MATIELISSAFKDHQPIPSRYSKDHEDFSPPLQWNDLPAGTQELALTCIDPDAPRGTFIHWVVTGIEPSINGSDEGKPPPGSVEGANGYGALGYGGPQPPVGSDPHRYFFRIHALNMRLNLPKGFTYEELQRGLAEGEIATGTLVGTYQR